MLKLKCKGNRITVFSVCGLTFLHCILLTVGYGSQEQEPIQGLEAVKVPLPWFDSQKRYPAYDASIRELRPNSTVAVTSLGRPPMEKPLALQLSRRLYPAKDGHLDVLVRFDLELEEKPEGSLKVELWDSQGERVSGQKLESILGSQLFFSYRLPESLEGKSGILKIIWERDGNTVEAEAAFEVAEAVPVDRSGRIPISVPNTTGAVLRNAPFTTGVPFPQGALDSIDRIRLVDESGDEIPLQVTEQARWSRLGGVKWVHCNFTLDLDGDSRELFLEYGPDITREPQADLVVTKLDPGKGFPSVEAGRLRLDAQGVWFDSSGAGVYQRVLTGEALTGAFVQRARGMNFVGPGHTHFYSEGWSYTMSGEVDYTVEENGPEKTVVRAQGWYLNEETGDRFCQYLVRYVVFRDSPVLRIFHTWIFTGDGNRDNIQTMGWKFPLVESKPKGFLSSFEKGEWLDGYYLRQHDHDEYAWFEFEAPSRFRVVWDNVLPRRPLKEVGKGRRAPGVMAASGENLGVYIGVKDFWQNFPASLRQEEDTLTFHQWPRYGRERQHPVYGGDIGNVWRLWFAHEGETLSFALPQALTENPIYQAESLGEPHFAHGQPDSVNAQGVAKTSEIWLYFAGNEESSENAVQVMEGLQEETIRAIVDPQWMTSSGAFGEITAANFEEYPEQETAFREAVLNPLRQVERMGVYGKWIYGDILRTSNLDTQEAGLYRTFRKAHWGWPYTWRQFVRSGDTEYLRFAQAATRMMTDTAFCHYVGEEVAEQFAQLSPRQMWTFQQPFRAIGWHNRNLIPWAGYWGPSTRCYVDKVDYLWDAWYVSGYHRARDVALTWGEQTRIEEPDKLMRGPITAADNQDRWPANLQAQYVAMYEATWNPWFLAAAEAIAELHLWRFHEQAWQGHFWSLGHLTWQRYSGSKEHMEFLWNHLDQQTDYHHFGWGSTPPTILPATMYAYSLTGDDYYLRRAAGVLDMLRWTLWTGDDFDYYRGFYVYSDVHGDIIVKSWLQLWFPLVMAGFDKAGGVPENPIYPPLEQLLDKGDRIAVWKEAGQKLPLRVQGEFKISGPDGEQYLEGDERVVVLPEEAPEGTYWIHLRGQKRLPLSPPDTREVLVPGEEGVVRRSRLMPQYWFYVPEGTESFWIEFDNRHKPQQQLVQVVIWNADSEEVWAHRQRGMDHDPEVKTIRAEIEVPSGQAGRLWQVTLPGASQFMRFHLSPELPPFLSHDRVRWFDPENPRGGVQ